MSRSSLVRSLWLGLALALFGCAPGASEDTGAADLTLTRGDGEALQIIHTPGASEVLLTPPVDGEVELLFRYNDPLVDVTLRTNANEVAEGELVSLPSDALTLEVRVDGVTFGAGDGSSGTVELQVLAVDDESGSAHVSAVFDVTLLSGGGETLFVEGFVEGSVGEAL